MIQLKGDLLEVRGNLKRFRNLRSHQVITLPYEVSFIQAYADINSLRYISSLVGESCKRFNDTCCHVNVHCCPVDLPVAAWVTGTCAGATIDAAVGTITAVGQHLR